MTYVALNAVFLAVAAGVAVTAAVRRAPGRRPRPLALVIALAAVLVLTAVFDNVMIAAGLFDYAPEHRLGWSIGRAPVEDFAYPVAGVLLLPALWHLLAPSRKGDP